MSNSLARNLVPPSRGPEGPVRDVRPPSRRHWLDGLARFGLVIRGVIYFVPGVLALQWAFGLHHQAMDPASVIALIGRQPLGRALLVLVAIGLAGYAAWGVVRAVKDPLRRGRSPAGLALRFGYLMSAVAYLGMLLATVRLLTGGSHTAAVPKDWTLALLARPFGGVIVAIIGVCWILGSGIAQIITGWGKRFERDLALERLGRIERGWAVGLGRVGIVSRGVVFTIIGVMLVAVALRLRSQSSTGLEGALLEITHQPFGRALLGAVAVGLMAFGTYSAMCARWIRMRPALSAAGPSIAHSRRS
jgi:hypothetical protein